MKLRDLLDLFDREANISVICAEGYISDQNSVEFYREHCATPEILNSNVVKIDPKIEYFSPYGCHVVTYIFTDLQIYMMKEGEA